MTWTLRRRIQSEVPNSGPTVASRTIMVVGKLVQSAALGIQQTLAGSGPDPARRILAEEILALHAKTRSRRTDRFGRGQGTKRRRMFSGTMKNIAARLTRRLPGRFMSRKSTVDLTTFKVSVKDFVALQEVGGSCIRCWPGAKLRVASPKELDIRCTRKWSGNRDACKMGR